MLCIKTWYWKPNFPREIQASKGDSASATTTADVQFGLAVRPNIWTSPYSASLWCVLFRSPRPQQFFLSAKCLPPRLTKYFPYQNLSPLCFFVPLLLCWPKLFLFFFGLCDPLLQCAILAALFHLTSDGLLLIKIWPKVQIVQLQTKWDLMERSTWIWIPDHLMVLINLKSWNLRTEGNRLWNPIYGGWCKTRPQPVNRTKIMRVRPI